MAWDDTTGNNSYLFFGHTGKVGGDGVWIANGPGIYKNNKEIDETPIFVHYSTIFGSFYNGASRI